MKKKLFNKEVKIGLMVFVAIFLLYFGLNFLKGIDIFTTTRSYYATYENLDGLVASSPVFIKGFKVGQVDEIQYDFSKEKPFLVKISIEKKINLPKNTKIQLFDNGLMGGKAIQLIFEPYASTQNFCKNGDTLKSEVKPGLMADLSANLLPKIESISTQTDSLLRSIRSITEGDKLNNSLASIERTTADLAETSAQMKTLMKFQLPPIMNNLSGASSDFKTITSNLKEINFASTMNNVDQTVSNLNLLTNKINNGEGSLGMLLTDQQLYLNLANTSSSANQLLIDLKNNPKRYVHFSLFGSKTK
ncbi:MAG: MCE family protein [Paludibacteraceae bacterium]|nr:MCE family protein [Paludibacteraceae bacterium]